ncbi:MAG: YggS family pyridoxal phosphate-dependent enzyme [Muribaculaceae bacterium]|nr:YggS family pyridoxal phosphate-dependent enzyme [Muribaculaceae bacterium]
MGSIAENLRQITDTLPEGVELVAVSKFHPAERLREAYDAGQRVFGESRAAELAQKAAALPDDICWHFIGHLQTNKVKAVVAVADVIDAVDSTRLLLAIDREACRIGRPVKVLLQAHVALEETKFGFSPEELEREITAELVNSLKMTTIVGLMGMASNVDDTERIAADFDCLRSLFHLLAAGPMAGRPEFQTLSMGMSDDYQLAIEHGSNAVRIGTDIFGPREY